MPFEIPAGWFRYGVVRPYDPSVDSTVDASVRSPVGAYVTSIVEEAAHEPNRRGNVSNSGRGWHTVIKVWLDPSSGEKIGESEPVDWSTSAFDAAVDECAADPSLCEKPKRRLPAILAASTVGVGLAAAVGRAMLGR